MANGGSERETVGAVDGKSGGEVARGDGAGGGVRRASADNIIPPILPPGLAVIGAGWGRTGTASLREALNILGFGPCYHMEHVFSGPQTSSRMTAWTKAGNKGGEDVDWDKIFDGYKSAVDFPSSVYYSQLMRRYPQAKIILTTRDPLAWWNSARKTILSPELHEPSFVTRVGGYVLGRMKGRAMHNATWLKVVFGDERPDKFSISQLDRDSVLERFQKWNDKVKNEVPKDKLLVYEVKDGWSPLCEFLGVPVPLEPFPRINDTAQFQDERRAERRKATLIGTVTLLTLTTGVALAAAKVAQVIQRNRVRA